MRYDGDGYDGSPYDGSGTVEIWLTGTGQAEISGFGDLSVGGGRLSGSGQIEVRGTGNLKEVINLSGQGKIEVSGTGQMLVTALLSGSGQIEISGTGDLFVYTSAIFTFSGTLAAGKTLVIDGQRFTVVNDGVNAIGDFSGEFPVLYPGTNIVEYTDTEGSRTVHIHVIKPGPQSTTEIPITKTLTYTGTLAAGKTLVIDGNDLTVENDGTNDLAHFTGDFPYIFPGTNTITYTDSAGSRTMKITVIREERSA
jgi:phage-related protein